MKPSDYPALFQKSDAVSIQQQECYLKASKAEFFFVFCAAVSGGFILTNVATCTTLAIITAVMLFFAFLSRLCIKIRKWDDNWFNTRAIAESVKTATWRYIMGAHPYQLNLSAVDVDKKFIEELDEIFRSHPEVHAVMASCSNGEKQISVRMKQIRALSLEERKKLYVPQRIIDQKHWYKRKSKLNEDQENLWFFIILGGEIVGIIVAVLLIFFPEVWFNPIGSITTLVAIFCAWIQIKKHSELSQAYSMAEHELTCIESLGEHVKDEKDFSDYIINAENAISREHTMWCAKRIN